MSARASTRKAKETVSETSTTPQAANRREWDHKKDKDTSLIASYAIRLLGRASEPDLLRPSYLRELDVEACDGYGAVLITEDLGEAQTFPSAYAAMECWRTQSKTRPLRDDRKPNRPLTAFSIEIVGVVEVVSTPISGELIGNIEAAE